MRGDSALGDAVHVVRANLNLDALATGTDHGRVERLVSVWFGQGDVILEASWNGNPFRVNDAERRVTIAHALDDDAKGHRVVNLLEAALLHLHLAVDRIEVLRAA